jgi:endonuclease/exonuclease/phosphatase family metal-dependent hydrolase
MNMHVKRRGLIAALVLAAAAVLVGCEDRAAISAPPPAPAKTDPPDRKPVEVTLVAYNVENYFDRHNDPYTRDEGTAPKSEQDKAELAAVIRSLDADFVGVTEMENEGELWAFKNEHLADLGYEYTFVGHRDFARGINNGAVSRIPIHSATVFRHPKLTVPGEQRTWTFARDVVMFDLRPHPDTPLYVFVVHFKSRRDSRDDKQSAKWRLSEAIGLRRIIDGMLDRDAEALIAVVGDLNDLPDSDPVMTLRGDGGPLGPADPKLVDLHAHLTGDDAVTYLRQPYRSRIDYILASPALAATLVPGSAKIPAGPKIEAGSDHAPVVATFVVR